MQIQHAVWKRTIAGLLAALIIIGAMAPADGVAATGTMNCNPVRFLDSVWQDLLGRGPTPGEKSSILNLLGSGASNTQVAQIVLNSIEYRTRLTQSLYQQLLRRAATQTEISSILFTIQQGATVEQLIAVIVGSDEYYQNRGGGTTNGFLDQLYKDLLGRPIDDGALAAFTDQLSKGASRLQVAQILLSSTEYRSNQLQSFFNIFLDREATGGELNLLLALWQQGARREQIIAQIIGSPEYCELARPTPRGHRQ